LTTADKSGSLSPKKKILLREEGRQMTQSRNDEAVAQLEAVRAVLSAFDWERDDRQYALEEIGRIVSAGDETPAADPNARVYLLRWNDTGAPYVSAGHRMEFALADAMRIADYEPVTVVDAGTGRVLWIGTEATRGAR
jgi:hypothetical protein